MTRWGDRRGTRDEALLARVEEQARENAAAIERGLAEVESRLRERNDRWLAAAKTRLREEAEDLLGRSVAHAEGLIRNSADELLRELAELLAAQADTLGRGARELATELERRRRIEDAQPREEPAARVDTTERAAVSEGLELLIAQMAAEGDSREEIAALLRGDFGIRDAEATVAAVLDPDQSSSP